MRQIVRYGVLFLGAVLATVFSSRPPAELFAAETASAPGSCVPPKSINSYKPIDICDSVYRVSCNVSQSILSGFAANVGNEVGLVTALHGVASCSDISVTNVTSGLKSGFNVDKVDVRHDVAFLRSAGFKPRHILSPRGRDFDNAMTVVGYPGAITDQLAFPVSPQIQPLTELKNLLTPPDLVTLQGRNSPEVTSIVLSLIGPLQPGFSGAPVLASNGQVAAVVDGGLGLGSSVGWAIPYRSVQWSSVANVRTALASLPKGNTTPLESYSTTGNLYFADSAQIVGRIYKLNGPVVSVAFQRPAGQIYSVAVSPKSQLFYCDANEHFIYKVQGDREQIVYQHSTYVRKVVFDRLGDLYFSEASGAGGDGTIYRMTGSIASKFFTVKLSEVGGYWAGDFAFDSTGALWLSSGNIRPARLYEVVAAIPQNRFQTANTMVGISFDRDGTLLYSDFGEILRLDLASRKITVVYQAPSVPAPGSHGGIRIWGTSPQ
jgi:hypothetical protein